MWIVDRVVECREIVQQQVGFWGEGEDDLQVQYTPAVLNVLLICFFYFVIINFLSLSFMSLKMFRIFYYHHLNIIPQSVVNKRWHCMGVDCTYRIWGLLYSRVWFRNVYHVLLLVGKFKIGEENVKDPVPEYMVLFLCYEYWMRIMNYIAACVVSPFLCTCSDCLFSNTCRMFASLCVVPKLWRWGTSQSQKLHFHVVKEQVGMNIWITSKISNRSTCTSLYSSSKSVE